ncbi:MAG: BMP family ABC transporter substrate-binding protein [Actinomycetota bacterium]
MGEHLRKLLILLAALSLLAAACGSDSDDDTEAGADTEAEAESDDEAEADTEEEDAESDDSGDAEPAAEGDAPTTLDIAVVLEGVQEEGWNAAMIGALDRITAEAPYDLDLSYQLIEDVAYADGERIGRDLANSGTYDMIIMHSAYVDSVNALAPDFPEIAFGVSGSGNDLAMGGNVYWIDVFIHEPAYLLGMIAGSMTDSGQISAVAGFPFANVNAPVHAFIDGAQSIDPDITASVTYIESWFDAVTANESAVAQIAAGSDMIYAERFGPVEAAASEDGVFAFGHFTDQSSLNPDIVLASAIALWDPAVMTIIDAWYDFEVNGTAYAAPAEERIVFDSMTQGGSDITELSDSVPAEVAELIAETREQILSGELEVPFDDSPFE